MNRCIQRLQIHAGVSTHNVEAAVEKQNFNVSNENVRSHLQLRDCFQSESLKESRHDSDGGLKLKIRKRNKRVAIHITDIKKDVVLAGSTQKWGRN